MIIQIKNGIKHSHAMITYFILVNDIYVKHLFGFVIIFHLKAYSPMYDQLNNLLGYRCTISGTSSDYSPWFSIAADITL